MTDSSEGIGVERLKTIIDSWTSDAAMSTVIDSGDLFHGQPIATLSKGESIAKITKALGYDLMTAANHFSKMNMRYMSLIYRMDQA